MSDAVISRIHQTLTRPVSYDHDAGKLGINEKELGQINNTFCDITIGGPAHLEDRVTYLFAF